MKDSKKSGKPKKTEEKNKQIARYVKNLYELHKMQAAVIRELRKLT